MATALIIWIGLGIAAAIIATNKGMNAPGWFVLGFIFGPIALIIVLVLQKSGPGAGEKKCPYCAEYVKQEAVICKYCGKELLNNDKRPENDVIEIIKDWSIIKTQGILGVKFMKKCGNCEAVNKYLAVTCKDCGWKPIVKYRQESSSSAQGESSHS
jgi:DNA-directed RNA polymerase subunit RPC12/RpoP